MQAEMGNGVDILLQVGIVNYSFDNSIQHYVISKHVYITVAFFMYVINNSGPKTDPWVTPDATGRLGELAPLTHTLSSVS